MFYLITIKKLKDGTFSQEIERKTDLKTACIFYHSNLRAMYNDANIETASECIMTESGVVLPNFREVINNASTTE